MGHRDDKTAFAYGQLAQIYDVPHLVTDVGLYLDSRELS
jgi:hypothetical protein